MTQLSLYPAGLTARQRFADFHRANPHVYIELVTMARNLKALGHTRYSVKGLWEVLRWRQAIRTNGEAGFKLNNIFTPYYARLIMSQEPDLAEFFETRRSPK